MKRKQPSNERVSCTSWIPGDVLPVRPGVYQRRYPNDEGTPGKSPLTFAYFDGTVWFVGFSEWDDLIEGTPERDALRVGKSALAADQFEWRGLTHEASECADDVRTASVRSGSGTGGGTVAS